MPTSNARAHDPTAITRDRQEPHRLTAKEFEEMMALAQLAHRYNHERFSMALAGRTPTAKLAASRGRPTPFELVN